MNKQERWYNYINITVMTITVMLFIGTYKRAAMIFREIDPTALMILICMVFLVHLIKACRLYLAFYGSDITYLQCLKIYCKVTPVSVVIPYKLGEFFRMYCCGKQIESVLKGVIIILLDRFMDTAALITAILLTCFFNGGRIHAIGYLLLIFLFFVLLIYRVFPEVCKFWKLYFLRIKATENKLTALKVLETLDRIYIEISGVTNGRGILLYFMSLTAWGVEMISISLLDEVAKNKKLNQKISNYLVAAMNGSQLPQLDRFVFVSVIFLIGIYVVIKIFEMMNRKKADKA